MTTADTVATRIPMPRISAIPMPNRPAMNSQSAQAAPAMALNTPANGPSTPDRKPVVGLPPLIHAFSGAVWKPKPNSLSTKAHRK